MNTCSCYHPLYVEEDDDKLNYRPCQISAGSKFYFLNKFVFLEHNIARVLFKKMACTNVFAHSANLCFEFHILFFS